MNVLITGVSGFIGNNLAEYLTQRTNDVIGICHSRLPKCSIKKVLTCDLAKDDLIECIGDEKLDAIVHLAGQMRGNYVCDYLDNTVHATRRLIRYAEQQQITRFIYISSISAYGETLSAVDEASDRINLDDYGMAKYICERMLEDSDIESRVVIRQPRTLGKGCDLSYPWLPKVAYQMMRDEPVYYMNPQLMYNNLLYVDDFSAFIQILLTKNVIGFERFVLGAKGSMSILQILELMKKNLASNSELIEKEATGRNKCYAIDVTKAGNYGFCSGTPEEILCKFCEDVIIQKGEIKNESL